MFLLYLLLEISYFLHLTSRIEMLGLIRFDLILAGVLLVLVLINNSSNLNIKELPKTTKVLLLLIAYIFLSLPFVTWPGSVIRFGLFDYSKVVLFYLFSLFLIDTEKKLKAFIYIFILCQIFRILEPTLLHVKDGYWGSAASMGEGGFLDRLSGAPHDVVNPNQLAWVILTTIPFIYHLVWSGGFVKKLLAVIMFTICGYAFLLTGSRSGLLSLGVLILAMAFLSKNRGKAIVIAACIVLPILILMMSNLSPVMKDRYFSIIEEDTANRGTFVGRIEGLKNGFSEIMNANPIFGTGLGTSIEAGYNLFGARRAQKNHNLYFEIAAELGLIGFVIFLLYIKHILGSLRLTGRKLERSAEPDPLLSKIIVAVKAWLIMHLFYSLSCFGLSSWEWYFFGGISAACEKLSGMHAQEISGREN